MELTMFGVNILFVLILWRFMIRKSILDDTRDKLFDLRDEVRATFVKNGWDLGSPVYKSLRDLLNGHLRFTEEFSIWRVAYLEVSVKRSPELQSELHERVSRVFAGLNAEQAEFIKSVRARALNAVMEFAVFSSGLLHLISFVIAPFVVVYKAVDVLGNGLEAASGMCQRSFGNVGTTISKVMSSASASISKRLFVPDLFENYSYRMGSS